MLLLLLGLKQNEDALAAFATSAGACPRCVEGREEEAKQCREALELEMGKDAVVDAASVAAAFQHLTRGVDTAGHNMAAVPVMQVIGASMKAKNWVIQSVSSMISYVFPPNAMHQTAE